VAVPIVATPRRVESTNVAASTQARRRFMKTPLVDFIHETPTTAGD